MSTIKAYAAVESGGELQPFEYDPGPLDPGQVEIAVEHCGICHSDLSMVNDDWGMSVYPLVPGHEVIGRIAAAGDSVEGLAVGRRVGLGWHAGYCMRCASCMSGDHNLCAGAQGTIVGHHGGFADRVRASAASVVPLPDGLDPAAAGPLLCGGITVFNPLVQFDVKPTDAVAVVGIGGLGHLALQFLRAWGCRVTAFTSTAAKRQEALDMGADDVVDSSDSSALEGAAGRFDLVLSTVNVSLDWNAYLATLRPRGRLHFVGATLEPLDLGVFGLIGGQHSVSGSPVGSPATIERMLDFAARHGIEAVVERYPFEKVNDAMERLASGRARYRVVLSR
jgi:uncharacterized zinc-type alcohol dehydrogenase-like protein